MQPCLFRCSGNLAHYAESLHAIFSTNYPPDGNVLQGRGETDATTRWRQPIPRGVISVRYPKRKHSLFLFANHIEFEQFGGAEGIADRNIGGIAASRHQHAAHSRNVVARIESLPGSADKRLEPRGEIHCRVGRRHTGVADIPRAIAGRNVHRAAQRDGQMREVAAYALTLVIRFPRGLGRPRVRVIEHNVVMHEVTDSLYSRASQWRIAERFPGEV